MEHKFKRGDVVQYIGFRTVFHNIPFIVLDSYTISYEGPSSYPGQPEVKIECQVLFGDKKRTFFQERLQVFKPEL